MKLLDTNVLVYAANANAPQHATSRSCLERAFASAAGIGFTWMTLVGFIRFEGLEFERLRI